MTHKGVVLFHRGSKYEIEEIEEHKINILPSSITFCSYQQWPQENCLLILQATTIGKFYIVIPFCFGQRTMRLFTYSFNKIYNYSVVPEFQAA